MKLELTDYEWKWLTVYVGKAGPDNLATSVAIYNKLKEKNSVLEKIRELETELEKLKVIIR